MRNNILLLYFIVLILFFTTACSSTDKRFVPNRVNEGDSAPNFSLLNMDDTTVTLDDFTGEKVYVKFWASWCSACLAGLKEIDDLSNQRTDFNVLTIVSPRHEGEMKKADFLAWFRTLEYDNITVLFDENGLWSLEYNVPAYPSSYYIGTDGVLVKSRIGHEPNDVIMNEMNTIF